MTGQEPSKADIDAILKRLRTISSNKTCFDCGTKNPTWASVTYGVFICIDCSATHRSLGVHLSFVKSTQLDTNWTWTQLRSMQLGGNANGAQFFEQQNCTTKDSQQKYNSRAAQLYRDKLHQAALKAQRTHGTKLFIDDGHKETHTEKKESDFFQEHTIQQTGGGDKGGAIDLDSHIAAADAIVDKSHEGPSVQAVLANEQTLDEQLNIKSNILQKKAPPAKKKGLGAQKVNANFNDIERGIHEQERLREQEIVEQAKTREESEKQVQKQMASMKLAYEGLDKQREKEETKLKNDPKKAQQLERLGMAAGNRNAGISHSALNDMQIIQQEGVFTTKQSMPASSKRDFFDDFDSHFVSKSSNVSSNSRFNDESMDYRGFNSNSNNDRGYGSGISGNGNSSSKSNFDDWVQVDDKFDDFKKSPNFSDTNYSSSKSSRNNDYSSNGNNYSQSSNSNNSYSNNKNSSSSNGNSSNNNDGDAMKRFANAKSISSDQYFGSKPTDFETRNQSARFENSTSISSDDYFGNNTNRSNNSGGGNAAGYNITSYAPDMAFLKQDLKDGVSRVAGRLSNMASNVMTQFQDM